MDKSVEKTVTLFRKSYAGRLTADERAEMACLLEDPRIPRHDDYRHRGVC